MNDTAEGRNQTLDLINGLSNPNLNDSYYEMEFDECGYYLSPFLQNQFYMVTIFGSVLSSISIFFNLIMLNLSLNRPYFRKSNFLYLTVIAVFDIGSGVTYIMLISAQVLYQYMDLYGLMAIWHGYAIPVFTASHITSLASTYLLVAVSVERYFASHQTSNFCTMGRRIVVMIGTSGAGGPRRTNLATKRTKPVA